MPAVSTAQQALMGQAYAKQKIKGKKNLQNLKDYRDWINSK